MRYTVRPNTRRWPPVPWLCMVMLSMAAGMRTVEADGPDVSKGPTSEVVTVILRYDDYSSRSATDVEVALIRILEERHIQCTFGVIPYVVAGDFHDPAPQKRIPLSSQKAELLRNAVAKGAVDVALHGYTHQTAVRSVHGDYSEFSGISYDEQVRKLSEGKQLLEGLLNVRISTFIPPWNSYDANTLRAMECLHMGCLSASLRSVPKALLNLKYLPQTASLPDLRKAVELAKTERDSEPIICLVFHAYDFREVSKERSCTDIQGFVASLDWLLSQEGILVTSVAQAEMLLQDAGPERLAANFDYHHHQSPLWRLTPLFLVNEPKSMASSAAPYISRTALHFANMRLATRAAGFYIVALGLAFCLSVIGGCLLRRIPERLRRLLLYVPAVCCVLLLAYSLRDGILNYRRATVFTMLAGTFIGLRVAWRNTSRQVESPVARDIRGK